MPSKLVFHIGNTFTLESLTADKSGHVPQQPVNVLKTISAAIVAAANKECNPGNVRNFPKNQPKVSTKQKEVVAKYGDFTECDDSTL